MTQRKHLFVMDPLENLNMKLDSSLRLAKALMELGQQCYITTPRDISWIHLSEGSVPFCQGIQLIPSEQATPTAGSRSQIKLTDFTSIHMRKDPPYDMDYISCTWLLAVAEKHGVRVYNDTSALRGMNEKLAIFDFPQYCDPGIVSSDPKELLKFARSTAQGDAIFKPLNLFGGRGVRRLQVDDSNHDAILTDLLAETAQGTEMKLIQPFNEAIFEGELRVFSCCGEILSWCLKKPSSGEFLANTRKGATLHEYQPPKKEVEMVLDVSAQLAGKGVKMVGFDIIGGLISEINITSPRLLVAESVDTSPYYLRMAEILLKDLGI